MKNWRGWAAIGAILMMVVGVFQILSGIFGLVNDQWIVQGYSGYFLVDVTGLAVWYIVIGAVLLFGGLYVVRGATWARVVGVVAASLAIISQLFMLPVHPIWSIVLLALYVLALIGFVAMDGPLEPEYDEPVVVAEEPPVVPRARSRSSSRGEPVVAAPEPPWRRVDADRVRGGTNGRPRRSRGLFHSARSDGPPAPRGTAGLFVLSRVRRNRPGAGGRR